VKTIAAILISASVYAIAGERTAEQQLNSYLASKPEPGSVFAQGALDGVNYRKLLRGAVAKDAGALAGIFRYTANGKMMGGGAESNCDILHQLLRLWSDPAYARVLAAEPPRVRAAVIRALDYAWPDPGWKPNQFPATYRLANHDTNYRK
jgi:hypothetical protein